MTESTKPFSRVVTRLTKPNDVLRLHNIRAGDLLAIKLGPPGYTCLVMLVGWRHDSDHWGQLFGTLQSGTRLTSHTEENLRADGYPASLESVVASIIGGCDFGGVDESFYRAVSTNNLKVGRCVLWSVSHNGRVSVILSPGRISEIEVRTT